MKRVLQYFLIISFISLSLTTVAFAETFGQSQTGTFGAPYRYIKTDAKPLAQEDADLIKSGKEVKKRTPVRISEGKKKEQVEKVVTKKIEIEGKNKIKQKTDDSETTKKDKANEDEEEAEFYDTGDQSKIEVDDPLESYNRFMFKLNDKIDKYALKPVATFYNDVVPKPLNSGIGNFFDNLFEFPTILNDILQAKFYQTAHDTWRLGLNSTIGVGGLFDMGQRVGLDPYLNSFGLTMARWGWQESMYFVIPVIGPSTIRDGLGWGVDLISTPLITVAIDFRIRWGLIALGLIDTRAQLLQLNDVYEEAALDKYVFMRNAFLQRRDHLINEGAAQDDPHEDSEGYDENYYLDE